MNKSMDERLLAFASREDLEKALLGLNPYQVVLIGYVDHTGDVVRWTPKMDAQGRLITAPVEERVQQALHSNNQEWVECIKKLPTGMFDSTPYKEKLLADYSKENV